jgi:predicted DCC family thiol-disulfide oxidoreductase YuxK
MKEEDKVILLFDGTCKLCNGTVNFILSRDKQDRFRFAALQSSPGKSILAKFHLDAGKMDSVVLIEEETAYVRSDAALRILKNLGGGWPLLYVFVVVPVFLRDPIYNLIAKKRYAWFGKTESCRVPDKGNESKFIS